ncbi:hypothetical protein ACLMJK_001728 [Lecanora helva]
MASSKPLIAFYGATGGSTIAALVPALKAGYDCTALARTPSKLKSMLAERGVSDASVQQHLTISQGDVLNVESCKGPLSLNGRPADIVISGIGIVNMKEAFSAITLCGDAVTNILEALKQLKPAKKPLFVVVSTTGITSGPRDVPLLFVPLYKLLLANPHRDKERMEKALVDNAQSSESVVGGSVIMRASLLLNGPAHGGSKVRVGTEQAPAVGYTINREDVGLWMFENLVRGDGHRFAGQKVSVTY